MYPAPVRDASQLPPWEYRQLTPVPYVGSTPNETTPHRRQASDSIESRSRSPGLATSASSSELATRYRRPSEQPTRSALAPYETVTSDAPAPQNEKVESERASTPQSRPNTRPGSLPGAKSIFRSRSTNNTKPLGSGTMFSRPSSQRPERPRRPKREHSAPSAINDEVAPKQSFTETFKSIFRPSTKEPVELELYRERHWTEDEY